MTDDTHRTRRAALLAGASVGVALLAGCGGPGVDEDTDETDPSAVGSGEADENDTGDERAPGEDEDEAGEDRGDQPAADG